MSIPRSASRDRTAGSASASAIAAFSMLMMSLGVPLGAKTPNQVLGFALNQPINSFKSLAVVVFLANKMSVVLATAEIGVKSFTTARNLWLAHEVSILIAAAGAVG